MSKRPVSIVSAETESCHSGHLPFNKLAVNITVMEQKYNNRILNQDISRQN